MVILYATFRGFGFVCMEISGFPDKHGREGGWRCPESRWEAEPGRRLGDIDDD